MLIFSPSTYTLLFSFSLFLCSVFFLSLFSFLYTSGITLNLSTSLLCILQESFDISILLTPISTAFSCTVCLISTAVFCFILAYFDSGSNLTYFCWFTFSFILCILILINFNDFFFVILGWDGLGVSSYFLILYFQSPSSVFSSSFTILINRLGDCFLVVFIILWWTYSPNTHFILDSHLASSSFILLLFLALSTKSALFPFSPWLPAAIAAPTPISSLVHSSTLVTAGLFLLIQNSSILTSPSLSFFILATSIFTSLYAGLASLLESDLKNVVALSTLSHLGFIGISISLSLPHLAFFHLLTHAFFNSSLFISIGLYIVSHGHYQDSRSLSSLSSHNPYFSSIILVSEANLLGLPFLSGFYSNDLVLEISQYSSLGLFLQVVIYLNVLLTFSYTLRILLSLSNSSAISPFSIHSRFLPSISPFSLSLIGLSILSTVLGILYSNLYIQSEVSLPFVLNSIVFLLLTLILCTFTISKSPFLSSKSTPLSYFLSSISFLSPLWSNLSSRMYLSISSSILSLEESFIKSFLLRLLSLSFFVASSISSSPFISTVANSSNLFFFILILLTLTLCISS